MKTKQEEIKGLERLIDYVRHTRNTTSGSLLYIVNIERDIEKLKKEVEEEFKMIKYFYDNTEVEERVFFDELINSRLTDIHLQYAIEPPREEYWDNLIDCLQDDVMSLIIFKNTKHTIGEGRDNFRVETDVDSLRFTMMLINSVLYYMEEG